MPNAIELETYYKTLTNNELLNLKREGGFTPEAERVLSEELAQRNLGSADLKRHVAEVQRNKLQDEVTERGGGYRSLGLQFFGGRYLNENDREANIQVRTKWFTMSGIPLIPIASYRFKHAGIAGKSSLASERRVIDRVSLDWVQVFITWFRTAAVFIGVGLLGIGISWYLQHKR